ncbi:MAG: hypothetical protein ACJAYU_004835 [Bradymonadia bacterium]
MSSHDDSDGDGLLDILEDSNRNCRVDSGETDPVLADSDGDGLADGDEDVDRNGRWDESRGELNPRSFDTDGDGISDGDEPIAAVCNSTLYEAIPDRVAFGGRELYSARQALLSETYDASAWIDFGSGRVDWVSSEPQPSADRSVPRVRVWFETQSATGTQRHSDWDYEETPELFGAMETAGVIGRVPDNFMDVAGPFAISQHQMTDGRSRVAITSSSEPVEAPSAEAISPGTDSILRARCVEADVVEPLDAVDLIFVFATDEESLIGAGEVFEALSDAMRVRTSAGLATRLWLVPADAHVATSAGAPLGGQGFIEPADARALFAELSPGVPDQRVWMNARAALQALAMGRLEGAPVLVTLASREDPEFRDGTTEGYDGHAFGVPHPLGPVRDALNRFYADFFEATVSDRQIHVLTGNCADARTVPSSPRELAATGEGVFVDRCGSNASPLLSTAVHRRADASRRVVGADRLLTGSGQTETAWDDESPTGSALGWVPIDADTPIPVGYLFWDSTPENE